MSNLNAYGRVSENLHKLRRKHDWVFKTFKKYKILKPEEGDHRYYAGKVVGIIECIEEVGRMEEKEFKKKVAKGIKNGKYKKI